MANNKRLIRDRSVKRDSGKYTRPEGAGNFDNMDDKNIVDQINIKVGTVDIEPRSDKEITNKKYVDDSNALLVPYTGATSDVDLGIYKLKLGNVELSATTTPDVFHMNVNGASFFFDTNNFYSTVERNLGNEGNRFDTAYLNTVNLGTNTIVDADVGNWNTHITHQDVTTTASPEFDGLDVDNINFNGSTILNTTTDLNIVSTGGDLNLDSATGEVDITAGTSVDIEALGATSNVLLKAGGLVSVQETGSQAQFIIDRTDGACCGFFNGGGGVNLYYEQGKAFAIATSTGANIRAGTPSTVDTIMVVDASGNISFSNSAIATTGKGTFGELSVGDGGTTNYTEISSTGDFKQKGSGNIDTEGKISSNTATLTASSDDYDVSGINTLFITTSGGAVVLGGLKGGVAGQYLYIARKDATNDLTLEHLEGVGTQDIYMHEGSDETIDSWGGFTLICDGSDWYDCSHAKHV